MIGRNLLITAIAAVLAAGGLLASGAPADAQDMTIQLEPFAGSSASATLELTAPVTSVATATGIAGAQGNVMIHVLGAPHCDWESRLALVWDAAVGDPGGENLSDGVTMNGMLVIYEDTPPGNSLGAMFSGSVSGIGSALMFEVFTDEQGNTIDAETRYLACGNADGSPVVGWEDALDENLRVVDDGAVQPAPDGDGDGGAAPDGDEAPVIAPPAGTGGYLSEGGSGAWMWVAVASVLAVAGVGLLGAGARSFLRSR